MKINQVEQLAGITKGNIRFYEKEGLLTPGRNSENGYREYDEADVAWLKKIRLLRMLDVPIDEILKLKDSRCQLDGLDADRVLEHMERKEQEGTKFMNVKRQDKRTRYVGPVIAAALMLVLMAGAAALIVWGFTISPEEAPPLWLVVVLAAVPLVVMVGVLLALVQRLKQIKGGEEDAAAQY